MDEPDIYGLLNDDEPTAQEKAKAYVAALRGQKNMAQAESNIGTLASATGNSLLSKTGAAFGGQAQGQLEGVQHQQDKLNQVLEARKQRNIQAQHYSDEQAHQSAEDDQKKAYQEALIAQGRFASTPAGGVLNTRTGQLAPPLSPGPGSGAGGAFAGLKPKDVEEKWKELETNVSTVKGRANLNAENQRRLYSAERLETLIKDPAGGIQNLTPQQVREAGTALANLISSGSMSVSQIQELTPVSLASEFASMKQKLLNEPRGADAQAFLQNMLDTAGREKATTLRQMHAGQLQGVPRLMGLKGLNSKRFESVLKGAGLDPAAIDENGLASQPAAAMSPGTGAPTHYLYQGKVPASSPMRRPADASGKPLGPPEPNPLYQKPDKVASSG